jgi:hypothetical protein
MKRIFYRILLVLILTWSCLAVCEAQKARNPERAVFKKSLHTKTRKVRESPGVVRAKKKQADNKKKADKEYYDYVKQQKKHAYEIQSPEVKARIVENRKDTDARYKVKKKSRSENSKKAGKKYN